MPMTRRTFLASAVAAPMLINAGGSVTARAQAQNRWRLLNIIAPVSTVPGHEGTMTHGEKRHASTMIDALPAHIASFSNGLGGLRQTTVESELPVTQASPDGGDGTVWVSPMDGANIYDQYDAATYDMVCLWTSGSVLRSSYSGLTVLGPYPNGASYIPVGDDPAMDRHATLPTHELAWQLCAYWSGHGFACPPDLDAAAYVNPRTGSPYDSSDGWDAFYTDLFQGKVNDGAGNLLGGSAAAWAVGRPTT
jgi:hypothetical protein